MPRSPDAPHPLLPLEDPRLSRRFAWSVRLVALGLALPALGDGDGRTDEALLARERAGGRRGIAICHASGELVRLGAGVDFGSGGDDWRWLDAWRRLGPSEQAAIRRVDPALPVLAADALVIEKRGAASALLHREGGAYRWHQLGG